MESCLHRDVLGSRRRVGIRDEEKAQAVRLVRQLRAESGTDHGTVKRVADQLGYRDRVGAVVGPSGRHRRRCEAGGDDRGGGADQGARAGESGAAPGERDPQVGVGFLRGGARPPAEVMVRYIDAHRDEFGVEPICTVLQVAPSTYYSAKSRPAVGAGGARRGDDAGADGVVGREPQGLRGAQALEGCPARRS